MQLDTLRDSRKLAIPVIRAVVKVMLMTKINKVPSEYLSKKNPVVKDAVMITKLPIRDSMLDIVARILDG